MYQYVMNDIFVILIAWNNFGAYIYPYCYCIQILLSDKAQQLYNAFIVNIILKNHILGGVKLWFSILANIYNIYAFWTLKTSYCLYLMHQFQMKSNYLTTINNFIWANLNKKFNYIVCFTRVVRHAYSVFELVYFCWVWIRLIYS